MKILRFGQRFATFCFIAVLVSLFALGPASTVRASTFGFHVSGRLLLDANGNNFIMRGINVPHNWYPDETASSLQNIKAKGANTVRIVLSSGQNWPKNSASDVATVISLCKANKLICVLEVHDTTGYGEDPSASSLAQAVAYWKEIKSVLVGQEAYVIINLGNEPYGNNNTVNWINDTKNAIAEMRNAGFQHMLIVDGPDWGQDWEGIMSANAASIFNSDALHNTVFGVHMYEVFEFASDIQSYVAGFVNAGLPLVIGEFGPVNGEPDAEVNGADVEAVMATAQANGIGYLGWEWSGDGNPHLDIVSNFDPNQETSWGNQIIGGENGICRTSVEASVYGSHPGPCSTFNDIPSNYWANNYIERLYNAGITSGCSTTPLSYCPESIVTRGQMSVFLEKGVHYPNAFTPPDRVPTFNDTVGHWAEDWIEALRNDGITGGCGTSLYCPEATVTRAQMAVFLLRSKYGGGYNPPAVGASTGFSDVPTSHWAAPWIKQLTAEGITGGCGTGIYCPESPVTRAQMAVFLVKTFNLP
jgi:mannan endo-1,4-beta-mannosidase